APVEKSLQKGLAAADGLGFWRPVRITRHHFEKRILLERKVRTRAHALERHVFHGSSRWHRQEKSRSVSGSDAGEWIHLGHGHKPTSFSKICAPVPACTASALA